MEIGAHTVPVSMILRPGMLGHLGKKIWIFTTQVIKAEHQYFVFAKSDV